jgi:hypothetical protein
VPVDRFQQADEVAADLQPSAGIGVAEGHGGIAHQGQEGEAVLDDDLGCFRGVGEAHRRPVPEGHAQRDALQPPPHPAEHPAIEASRPGTRGAAAANPVRR